jgi:hypothetical protein
MAIRRGLALLLGCCCLPSGAAAGDHAAASADHAAASADHAAKDDPPEAVFTERAFVERNLELEADADFDREDGNELDLAARGTWTWANRFQLGLEVPYTVTYPRDEPQQSSLSDVGVSAQFVFCCERDEGIAFFSLRASVDAPTGSVSKSIGGNGAFEVSLLGDYGVPVVPGLDELSVQAQITYDQELGTTPDERETAEELRRPAVREKEIQWNLALVQPLFERRFTPVLELLGSSVVDAADPADEDTSVQLGVGFWIAPFDTGPFSSLSLGVGYRFPISRPRGDDGGVMATLQWTFD